MPLTALTFNGEPLLNVLKDEYSNPRWRYLTKSYVEYMELQVMPFNVGRQSRVAFIDLSKSILPTPPKSPIQDGVKFEGAIYFWDGTGYSLPKPKSFKDLVRDEYDHQIDSMRYDMNRQAFGVIDPYQLPRVPWHRRLIAKTIPLRRRIARKIYDFEDLEDWDY